MNFNDIPADVMVPGVLIEVDTSQASRGVGLLEHRVLILGQRLAAGTVAAGVPQLITRPEQAETYFGRGSMLAGMVAASLSVGQVPETWAIALDDNGAGVAATGKLTLTGPATASGTLVLYVAGVRLTVGVTNGDSAIAVAAAIVAELGLHTDLPVTAAVNGVNAFEVDLTCNWKGETGNDIDVRANYYQGEQLPTGIGVAVAALAGGAGNPDVTPAIAAMAENQYHSIALPYSDSANLAVLETEMDSRWKPPRMIEGMAYGAYRGTHAASVTFGSGRNSAFVSIMATGTSPFPPYLWAAVIAAVAAKSLAADPARPLQTLDLTGLLPQRQENRYTHTERDILLNNGMATHNVVAGRVQLERAVTTYQNNASGVADTALQAVQTVMTVGAARAALNRRMATRFPRHKLANNGAPIKPGQSITTPNRVLAEAVGLYAELVDLGWVQDLTRFKKEVFAEINASDPNRLDMVFPMFMVGGLRVMAVQIAFQL